MEDLFSVVVRCKPRENLSDFLERSPSYTILCAQEPEVGNRLKLLRKRLSSSTEETAVQNIIHIVNTCISNSICPSDVEEMMQELTSVAQLHRCWYEFLSWMFALAHYYCTDDFTVSLFLEFELPTVAIEVCKDNPSNEKLVMAVCVFLKHFSQHELHSVTNELLMLLKVHKHKRELVLNILRNLSEYTSFSSTCNEKSVHNSSELVESHGIYTFYELLTLYEHDVDTIKLIADICINVLVSGVTVDLDNLEANVIIKFSNELNYHKTVESLIISILRVFAHYPRSLSIDWSNIASLLSIDMTENVLLEGVKFLTTMAMTTKETKRKMYESGCIERVITAMRTYLANAELQECGCSLLSYLSFDSESITSSITEWYGIELVLDAMKRHSDNEQLLLTACAALSGLTFNNQIGQDVVYRSGGIAIILDAMRFSAKAKLQENACLAIGTMCWNNNLKRDVVRLGGVACLTQALREHVSNAGVVKNACRAIAQIVFNNERFRQEVSAADVIPLIIQGMTQHALYDRVQLHGCLALSYLCWTNNTSSNHGNYLANQRTGNNNNNNNNNNNSNNINNNSSNDAGFHALLRAMSLHPHSCEVQEHACRALANINHIPTSDCAIAVEHVLAAMRRHVNVGEVQEAGCRAIVTLALISASNKEELFRLGAAEVVIAAMQHFPLSQLVQQEACNALAHLAYEHNNLNHAITSCNGVALLLSAMRNHKDNNKLQLSACGGLSALAFDNTIAQRQIYELSGVHEIIYAMNHTERVRMLELGCSVLGTLAWNTEIKEKVATEAVPEILKQMRLHQTSALLQKSTCRAISQFAFNSEANRRLLVELGAIPLIVRAMREHVTTEKLIAHAIKALTYLCWENSEVAMAIIHEGIETVLQMVVKHYMHAPRVYNEAIHLSKILFRKTNGSITPVNKTISPPIISPIPLTQTPSTSAISAPHSGTTLPGQTPLSHSPSSSFCPLIPSAPNIIGQTTLMTTNTATAATTALLSPSSSLSELSSTLNTTSMSTTTPVYSVMTEPNLVAVPANLSSYIPAFSNEYGYIVVPTTLYQPTFQLSLVTPTLSTQPQPQLQAQPQSQLTPLTILQTSSTSTSSPSPPQFPLSSIITLSPTASFPPPPAPPPPPPPPPPPAYSENVTNGTPFTTASGVQTENVNMQRN